jgi:choline dehydrogenase-like flavoprotein
MIIDISKTKPKSFNYDLIIIGSGPAGTTILNEVVKSNIGAKIALIETGAYKPTSFANELKTVFSDKLKIKNHSRERVLGGASTTWSGLSSPFEHMALQGRSWMQDSKWPISVEELETYYHKASEHYRFPPLKMFDLSEGDSNIWLGLRKEGDYQPLWNNLEEKLFLNAVPQQNFYEEHKSVFESEDVDVYINASAKEFISVGSDKLKKVESLVVMTPSKEKFVLTAKQFVLCTGGIENARILLNSSSNDNFGLGNYNDLVGRYMMNHPKRYQGILKLKKPIKYLPFYFGCMWNNYSGYAGIMISRNLQKKKELSNAYIRFEPIFPWSDNLGVESFVTLIKKAKFAITKWAKVQKEKVIEIRSYAETGDAAELTDDKVSVLKLLSNVIFNLNSVFYYSWFRLFKRPVINEVRLCTFIEMEPHYENRVILSEHRDAHGYRLPTVSYAPTDRDRRTFELLTETFKNEIENNDFGTLTDKFEITGEFYESINSFSGYDASHHCGTTRMGADERTGVVDENQKVFGTSNLYISGSSVFPTSCVANPTYTIVALSIRLAEIIIEARRNGEI